jgi:hypothetical protein
MFEKSTVYLGVKRDFQPRLYLLTWPAIPLFQVSAVMYYLFILSQFVTFSPPISPYDERPRWRRILLEAVIIAASPRQIGRHIS